MKKFVIAFLLVKLTWRCFGGTAPLPEIPAPKLGVPQVLEIFAGLTHNDTNLTVVGIDWCKASDFQSRFGGPIYSPGKDHSNEYSWFITYVYKDERTEKLLGNGGIKQRYNTVAVERIKDDGQRGLFIGVQ